MQQQICAPADPCALGEQARGAHREVGRVGRDADEVLALDLEPDLVGVVRGDRELVEQADGVEDGRDLVVAVVLEPPDGQGQVDLGGHPDADGRRPGGGHALHPR